MAVTVKDLMGLEIMRDFKLVAGEKGLGREIKKTEILDFEFIQEGEIYRKIAFEGNSIVLSSLLFAKDKPELILDAIKKLISQNVQAMAYKPVFFTQLPKEALEYADRMGFPVLEFGRDEYFEDIIFCIRSLVEQDDILAQAEPIFGEILSRTLSKDENVAVCEKLNPLLRPWIQAVCVRAENMGSFQIASAIRRVTADRRLQSKTFIGKYQDCFMIILSQDEKDPARFKTQLEDVLLAYGLMGKKLTAGLSNMKDLQSGLDKAVRQAYWSEKTAEIEKEDVKQYQDLGIYKLIISNLHTDGTLEYMQDYLAPLFEEEEKDGELLRTAIAYILAGGDTIKTAEQLYCHKNTIRYRIGKLQEKLDPGTTEKEFYQNLSAAVRIYLLLEKSIKKEKKE